MDEKDKERLEGVAETIRDVASSAAMGSATRLRLFDLADDVDDVRRGAPPTPRLGGEAPPSDAATSPPSGPPRADPHAVDAAYLVEEAPRFRFVGAPAVDLAASMPEVRLRAENAAGVDLARRLVGGGGSTELYVHPIVVRDHASDRLAMKALLAAEKAFLTHFLRPPRFPSS